MPAIKSAKHILREEMKNIIENISAREKQRQSKEIFEKLTQMPQYQKSKRISIYLSMKNEIDTTPILKHMFSLGKEAFVPRYNREKMEMVKLSSMNDFHRLPENKWGIKKPSFQEIRDNALETGGLDLIVVPGLAFTKSGKRLGYGKGYYDKFLYKCVTSQSRKAFVVALALKEQIREEVPVNEEDFSLDMVLCAS